MNKGTELSSLLEQRISHYYTKLHIDEQGFFLYKLFFILLALPIQRLVLRVAEVENVILWVSLLSFTLLVLLQLRFIQTVFLKFLVWFLQLRIFQKYFYFFLRVENYLFNPRNRWLLGILIPFFVISFYGQFIFYDSLQLWVYTTFYIIPMSYIGLRSSKLFSSPPTSWERVLQMITFNLKIKEPIPNRLGYDYTFRYTASGPVNLNAGYHGVGQASQLVSTMTPNIPPRAPDGSNAVALITGIFSAVSAILINIENQRSQERIAREKLEAKRELERQKWEAQKEIEERKCQSNELIERLKHGSQNPTEGLKSNPELRRELEESGKRKLDVFNDLIEKSEGKERDALIEQRDRAIHEGLGIAKKLLDEAKEKANSPKEWDLYSHLCFEFFF